MSSNNCSFCLVNGMRKAVLMASLICIAICTASCRSVKEIEIVTDTIATHDTTIISVHDTTKVVDIRYDSIDRYVEKIVFVDTNGVVHEKEVEHLTKIITVQKEEYQNTIENQRNYISLLEKKLKDKETIKEVEKPLKWYQKTLMYAGIAFFVCIIAAVAYLVIKHKRKD